MPRNLPLDPSRRDFLEQAIAPRRERTGDPQIDRLFTREYRRGYELPRV